jgi:hypothetical protein
MWYYDVIIRNVVFGVITQCVFSASLRNVVFYVILRFDDLIGRRCRLAVLPLVLGRGGRLLLVLSFVAVIFSAIDKLE